jgi:two-component system OmpR family sensor kinase
MIDRLSLRARLTLWYTIVLVVALAIFGADVLIVQQRLGLRRLDEQLGDVHATLMKVLRSELEEGSSIVASAQEAIETAATESTGAAVFDEQRHALGQHPGGLEPALLLPPDGAEDGAATVDTPHGAWRVQTRREQVESSKRRSAILVSVARPLSDIDREKQSLREAMLLGFPVALLLAAAGGFGIASIALRPITGMATQASRIQPNGLEELGSTDRHDELGQLARAFNGLVARLRNAIETERQFMADASHELRTPISVVRTAADVALDREHRDEPDYRETLAIVRDESRRLSRLVEDMLTLARADAGGHQMRRARLYLDDVIADCRRAVAVLAADRGIAIHAEPPDTLVVNGDEQLLRQMLLNLLQNAIQNTPPGGTVTVRAETAGDSVTLSVADTGRGIAAADRERIFDRFVQLDPSRSGSGTGLGLPIARWIAEAHGGTLTLESSGSAGSVFRVSLPRPV